jgi:hypothetical protein
MHRFRRLRLLVAIGLFCTVALSNHLHRYPLPARRTAHNAVPVSENERLALNVVTSGGDHALFTGVCDVNEHLSALEKRTNNAENEPEYRYR